jgi:hypothetical protein
MTFQPGANVYTQGFGSRPENIEVPHLDIRDPSSTDINYPVGKIWINTILKTMYFLPSLSSTGGFASANWTKLEDVSGSFSTLSNGTTKVSPDSTGNISITGTNNEISVTSNPGSNNLTLSLTSDIIIPGSLTVNGEIIGHGGEAIDGGSISMETGANPFTVNSSSTGNVSIGNLTGGSVNITSGAGGITLDSANGGTITIAPSHSNIINIGSSSVLDISVAAQTIDLTTFGSGVEIETSGGALDINKTGTGNTNIGNNGHQTNISTSGNGSVHIGNTSGTQTTLINGGSGGITLSSQNGSVISLGPSNTEIIRLGNSNTTAIEVVGQDIVLLAFDNHINITGPNVNINTSGNGNVAIGNDSGTSTTTIDGGSGGIKIGALTGSNTDVQIGPNLPNIDTGNILLNSGGLSGCILLNGGQRVLVAPIATSAGPLSTSNFFLPCDTTSAAFTVTLPASPALGQQFVIADVSGSALTNNITIDGNGQMINGNPTAVINTPYGRVILFYVGTAWSR